MVDDDDGVSRRATFGELLTEAQELDALCEADVGVLVFDSAGRQMDYCSPHTSWSELTQRYKSISNDKFQGINPDDDHQQLLAEISRLRRERDRLEASVRRQSGDDLPPAATAELGDLEQQQQRALAKVREMKEKLLQQQLDESYHRVHILEDQNSFLRHMMSEEGRQRAAVEASAVVAELMAPPIQPATLFGGFFPEVKEEGASTSLRLWPQQFPGCGN
ncbi:MADS-box transcription factor 29-like isoform X1 [Hordeum vulgare subsp. vulgare]|uniref:MADS-box transcription factor 29-like isoform X1 n=1 Tax=Hordeum vulgare subsp. vulgare TaxID=112509 RepID=UPI001D1A53F9|nr:MADS-box transcription factor 29-like isoform X1 [Hordeum vulgare subsp. vulgare]